MYQQKRAIFLDCLVRQHRFVNLDHVLWEVDCVRPQSRALLIDVNSSFRTFDCDLTIMSRMDSCNHDRVSLICDATSGIHDVDRWTQGD